LLMDGGDVSVR